MEYWKLFNQILSVQQYQVIISCYYNILADMFADWKQK